MAMRPSRSPLKQPHLRRPRINYPRGQARQGLLRMLFLNPPRSRLRGLAQDSNRGGTHRRRLRTPTLRHTDSMALSLARFRTEFRMACRAGQTYSCQRTTQAAIALSRCAPIIETAGRLGLLPREIPGMPATRGSSAT